MTFSHTCRGMNVCPICEASLRHGKFGPCVCNECITYFPASSHRFWSRPMTTNRRLVFFLASPICTYMYMKWCQPAIYPVHGIVLQDVCEHNEHDNKYTKKDIAIFDISVLSPIAENSQCWLCWFFVVVLQSDSLSKLEAGLAFKTEAAVDDAIQKLEYQLRTRHFKLSEENRIVKEIDSLRRSKKKVKWVSFFFFGGKGCHGRKVSRIRLVFCWLSRQNVGSNHGTCTCVLEQDTSLYSAPLRPGV